MDKKKLTIIGVVVGVLIVGGLVNRWLSQSAAERAFEAATGGNVDIDSDGDEVTVKTEDGTWTAGSTLPSDFPTDAPLYPDAKVVGTYAVNAQGGTGYSASLQTDDNVADVASWYKREIVAKGWTIVSEMTADGSLIMSATKGERALNVVVGADDDGVTIGIVVANQ